jgi:hypothetical protein
VRWLKIIVSALAALALPLVVYPWLWNIGLQESAKIQVHLADFKSPVAWIELILYFVFFLGAFGICNDNQRVLPRNVRLLTVIAGCFSGFALLSFIWLSLSAIPLILGALVQSKLPRLGRWLIAGVAPALSTPVIGMGAVFWAETARGRNRFSPAPLGLALDAAWMVAPILLTWCDAVLLLEAFKPRRAHQYAAGPE